MHAMVIFQAMKLRKAMLKHGAIRDFGTNG
jgi:hypothetical protein